MWKSIVIHTRRDMFISGPQFMSHCGMKSQKTQYSFHLFKGRRLGVEKVGRGMMSLILELVALEGPALSRCGNCGHFGHNKRTCQGPPMRVSNGGRGASSPMNGERKIIKYTIGPSWISPCVATGSVANRGSEASVGSRSEIGQSGDDAIITTERVCLIYINMFIFIYVPLCIKSYAN